VSALDRAPDPGEQVSALDRAPDPESRSVHLIGHQIQESR